MTRTASFLVLPILLVAACETPTEPPTFKPLEAPALTADLVQTGPGIWRESLGGGYARAVNANGDVAGNSGRLAFYWTEAEGFVSPPFPGWASNAFDIGDDGVLVGSLRKSISWGSASPMRWTPGDADATRLSTYYGQAYAVNEAGTVLGEIWVGNAWHVVTWDADGNVTDDMGTAMGFIPDASMNENGDVVFTSPAARIFVKWAGDATATYTGLTGLVAGINDAGQITGRHFLAGGGEEGFVLDRDGTYTVVPSFDAMYASEPMGINNQGHVVGTVNRQITPYSSAPVAFYWAPGCELIQLDGSALSGGTDVNEIGHVSGYTHHYGFTAVRWTIDLQEACIPIFGTPAEETAKLSDEVGALEESGVFSAGEANSLTAKLDAALNQLDRGNTTAAANQLGAFINAVEALVRSGRLDAAAGDALIVHAQAIIDAMA